MNISPRIQGFAFLTGFALCIPAANWMIGNLGSFCVPNGPCLIPVAPGIMAPSGVLMIGLALVLRDLVQRRLGLTWAFAAIILGVVLSALLAPPALVLASAAAFLLSETADLAVYTPLQKRGLVLAVALSHRLELPLLDTPRPGCLVVDDIYETGRTLEPLRDLAQARVVVWVSKAEPQWWQAVEVTESNEWIVFPWENAAAAALDEQLYRASR